MVFLKRFGLSLGLSALLIMINTELGVAQFLNFDRSPFERFFFTPEGDTGVEQLNFVAERIINVIRTIVGLIATLLAIVSALRLAFSQGDSSAMDETKNVLFYSVVGIIIIALSSDLGKLFALNDGGLLGTKNVVEERLLLFDNGIRIVITFFKYILTAVGIGSLIYSASSMITGAGDEETISAAKKNFGVTLGAMVGLIFMDSLVRRVFYRVDTPLEQPRIDLGQGIQELVGFMNLIVSFAGPLVLITFVAGGLMYAASGGNEETQSKARKMMGVSLGGIVLIYGSFALVSTVIAGSL